VAINVEQYDLKSLVKKKALGGTLLLASGIGCFIFSVISILSDFNCWIDLTIVGFSSYEKFLTLVDSRLVTVLYPLLILSLCLLWLGISFVQSSGLLPLYKCSNVAVRRMHIAIASEKRILLSMAFYDLEPGIRDLALFQLTGDCKDYSRNEFVIQGYITAVQKDSYLFNDKIERMMERKKKVDETARIAARKGMLSLDRFEQMKTILLSNPSKTSAKFIIEKVIESNEKGSYNCSTIKTIFEEVLNDSSVKPWIKEMIEDSRNRQI